MTNPIIGKKIKMEQIFQGVDLYPITWISIEGPELPELSQGLVLSKITGFSKGKGFQGVVKRHGFAGGPKTRGQKNRHRAPGSLGPTAPQRVIPGRKMAGRTGGDKKTLKRIKILEWQSENKMLAVKGSIPGARGSKVKIYI